MKATLKTTLFAFLMVAGLSLASCKDKDAASSDGAIDTTSTDMVDPTTDTVASATPDTISETTDTVTNPVGP